VVLISENVTFTPKNILSKIYIANEHVKGQKRGLSLTYSFRHAEGLLAEGWREKAS